MEKGKNLGSVLQIPASQFAHNKRVNHDTSLIEQFLQVWIPVSEM